VRWIQRVNPDGTSRFDPRDESAARIDEIQGKNLNIIRGNFDAFRSSVDQTIISSQRDYDNHNKRNGVVNASEFSPEYYAGKAKEREKFFKGEHTSEESFARKQELYDKWTQAERNN
jgi:hypothetical protein